MILIVKAVSESEINDSWNIHKYTEFRGPLEPGEVEVGYTRAVIGINSMIDSIYVDAAEIEYMDGTTETLSRKDIYLEYMEDDIVEQLEEIDFDGPDCRRQMDAFVAWSEQFGVNRVQIRFLFDEILRLKESQGQTVDGEEYDTVKDAEKANEEIQQMLNAVKAVSGNDRAKIEDLIATLEKSNILSKGKYIDYLRKQMEAEDLRYRTVKEICFNTREEAEIAREEAAILTDIFYMEKDKTSIREIEKLVEAMRTPQWKEEAEKYLTYCREVITEQEGLDEAAASEKFDTIGALVDRLCPLILTSHKAEVLNVSNQEWDEVYAVLLDKLCIINGQRIFKPEEAIKAHYTWIEHAKGFYKYRTEKAVGGGFLSKLKTGITGVVYKNYEEEYMALTKNDTVPLPNDGKEYEEQTVLKFYHEYTVHADLFDRLVKKFELLVAKKITIDDCRLDMSKLFVAPVEVDEETIHEILGRLFPSINRPGFY